MNIDTATWMPLVRLFKVDGTELVWSNNVVKHDYEKGQSYTLTLKCLKMVLLIFMWTMNMASQADTGYEVDITIFRLRVFCYL